MDKYIPKKRLLFIGSGPAMPTALPVYSWRFELLSHNFGGDIITPTVKEDFNIDRIGEFRFHPIKFTKGNIFYRSIYYFCKTFFTVCKLCINSKKEKYYAIISPNPFGTGIISLIVSKIFNIKTIIEINGDFKEAFKYGSLGEIQLKLQDKIKEYIALKILVYCVNKCNSVRLLYGDQLKPFSDSLHGTFKTAVFADYVPVSKFISQPVKDEKYILLLGFPWYLKGVDILIEAFKLISCDFKDYTLKIFGWNPVNRAFFEKIAEGNDRIILGDSLEYSKVIDVMSACSIYVLASRTEAMGRVLIEAMACRKPIIASRVGGVSSIIKDGYNGLLFENENIDDLALKLRQILSNEELKISLCNNAFEYATKNLSEEQYLNNFDRMVSQI
jgi:glycosyltransferase involved in cell wall biosynthesis